MDAAKENDANADTLNWEAKEEKFAKERRKQEYEAAIHLYFEKYKDPAEALMTKRPDEYKAMRAMESQAEKLAKNKDYGGAREHLERAIQMGIFIVENPENEGSPLLRNMKKMNQQWKNRVAVYLKQVSNLDIELKGSSQPDGQPIEYKPVHRALAPLLSLFDPKAFDRDVEVLEQTKSKSDAYRKKKEQVLTRIRGFQNQLKTNSVLKYVTRNPISAVHAKPLQDTLRNFEAEVLGL
jgi:hypothetical protein